MSPLALPWDCRGGERRGAGQEGEEREEARRGGERGGQEGEEREGARRGGEEG